MCVHLRRRQTKAEIERKREEVNSVCSLHLSVGMSLSRQGEFQDAYGVGGGGRVEGVGLWSGDFW